MLVVIGSDLQVFRFHLLQEARVALALVPPVDAHAAPGGQLDAQRVAERRGDLLELQDLPRIRLLVDAVKRGNSLALEISGHRFVGGQHELLDKAVCDVALRAGDAGHAPELVELDERLRQVEVDGTALLAPLVQDERQLFHQLEILHKVGVALAGSRLARQNVAHRRVGHALGAADDTRQQFVLDDAPLRVDFHQRRHHQPVHVRIEAADAVRELQRQHGHGAIGEIHGGAAQARLAVERRAGTNVVRHVRDVHLQKVISPGEAFHVDGVVKILGRLAVDGDDGQAAEIAPALVVVLGDVLRRRVRGSQHLRGEPVRQVKLADDDFHIHAEVFAAAQNLDNAAAWQRRRARIAGHLDVHDQSVQVAGRATAGSRRRRALPFGLAAELPVAAAGSPARLAGLFTPRPFLSPRDDDLKRNAVIEGHHVVVTRAAVELAHHGFLRAVGDQQNAALHAAVVPPAQHLHFHAVAVHGGTGAISRDEDVHVGPGQRRVRHHKAIAVAMADEAAAHPVGRTRRRRARGAARNTVRWHGKGMAVFMRQREVVLLERDNSAIARQVLQHVLQLARLAGAQSELQHQLTQAKRAVRVALENGQDILFGRQFTHGWHLHSLAPRNSRVVVAE